ncbi:amidase family protein [Actinomadura sp. GTD37]|uniref:amidase family protein n=1 Tax=Actinomadura sp. GTD37 TaxID=1778030 RepID=UPI0035C21403
MQLHEYARCDAIGLRELIKAGEVTADEVEAVAREALAAADAEVNGLALPLFSPALDHAADGPFAGVPFLIKDHGPVAKGIPFSLGSRALQGATARHDSGLMARFRAAGLVTLGTHHRAGDDAQLLHRIGQIRADAKSMGSGAGRGRRSESAGRWSRWGTPSRRRGRSSTGKPSCNARRRRRWRALRLCS